MTPPKIVKDIKRSLDSENQNQNDIPIIHFWKYLENTQKISGWLQYPNQYIVTSSLQNCEHPLESGCIIETINESKYLLGKPFQ